MKIFAWETAEFYQFKVSHLKVIPMEKRTTYSTAFILRASKSNKHKALIYCRITVDMQRAEFSIKKKIRREIWDNGWAKTNSEEGKVINAYLKRIESEVFHYYRDMLASRKMITAEGLKNAYLGIQSREHSLMSLVEYHNTQMKDTLAWGTMKNYSTSQKYIKRFLKDHHGKSDMYLTELNYKFIVDFEYFLRNWKPIDHHRPLWNNGVMKHIERFRKMINVAIRMEWLDKDPFVKYKQKFEKVEREFLSSNELKAIENKELKNRSLAMGTRPFHF